RRAAGACIRAAARLTALRRERASMAASSLVSPVNGVGVRTLQPAGIGEAVWTRTRDETSRAAVTNGYQSARRWALRETPRGATASGRAALGRSVALGCP